MPPTATHPADWAAPSTGGAPALRGWLRGRVALWMAGALALGCSGPARSGRALGEDLGTFAIGATLAANDCGPNALGSPESFNFHVELARDYAELFWDGRAGTLGPELDFEVSARTRLDLRAARAADPGCTIERADLIAGALEPDEAGAVVALHAEMSFRFAVRSGSTCTAAEQDGAGLPRLPCQMSYTLDGQRDRAPMAEAAE